MFQPKFLRSTDGEVVLAAKGYNVPWLTLRVCVRYALIWAGFPGDACMLGFRSRYKARVITSWLADVTTLLVHDEIYQTEELILLAQLMLLGWAYTLCPP